MNPEIKAQWIEALRSGEYKQAQKQLRTGDDRFCCLGVLCNLIPDLVWTSEDRNGWSAHYDEARSFGLLPYTLRDELGISGERVDELTELNDQQGRDFNQIADWIELYL